MHSSLNNDILLSMQPPADLVPLPRRNAQLRSQAPNLKAVRNPRRSPVIPRG